ncbi:hypothetical protein RchiOBHm_Chr1g0375691 [Rosa chinensis]|uniref:Uncharacterized protein n=1 Tax=Rosa chinensis TaxID=74649 RepID=A0A2P6SMR1_ROSCH|nr:hypothetical protein RchiOBHm_Chr1g0375691 [Rosa chinensis]
MWSKKRVYFIQPQLYHYACIFDLLRQARLIEEVEKLIRNMLMKPDVFVCGALLGGCQSH